MHTNQSTERYVAFLRGINVGGHHKVPMADLREELQGLGFEHVVTLLNSGNIIFDSSPESIENLEDIISKHLEKTFGFAVPTIIRKSATISQMNNNSPFQGIEVTKDIRLYVSLLQNKVPFDLELPWHSADNSYQIIERRNNAVFSVLDLSVSGTPAAMKELEAYFGKGVTTRNWKTIERIAKKL